MKTHAAAVAACLVPLLTLPACETPESAATATPSGSTVPAKPGGSVAAKPSGSAASAKPSAAPSGSSAASAPPFSSATPGAPLALVDKPLELTISGKPFSYSKGYLMQDSFGVVSILLGGPDVDCTKPSKDHKVPDFEVFLGKTNPLRWAGSEFAAHVGIKTEDGQYNGVDPVFALVRLPSFTLEDKDFQFMLAIDSNFSGKVPVSGAGSVKIEICQDKQKPWTKLKSLPTAFDGSVSGKLDGKPFTPKSVFATVATDKTTKAEYVTGIWFFEKEGDCKTVVTDLQTKAFGRKVLITARGLQSGNPLLGKPGEADASFSEAPFLGAVLKVDKLGLKEGEVLTGSFAADNFAEKPGEVSSLKGQFEAKVCHFP
ncbi:MAG: hypothetical protein U0414_18360 [Polyangiaceae bacterium]